jgi:hypothetical protein
MPGEHPNCADGILQASGFSYLPEELNDRNLFIYLLENRWHIVL